MRYNLLGDLIQRERHDRDGTGLELMQGQYPHSERRQAV